MLYYLEAKLGLRVAGCWVLRCSRCSQFLTCKLCMLALEHVGAKEQVAQIDLIGFKSPL